MELKTQPRSRDFPPDFIFGSSVAAYQVDWPRKGSSTTDWDQFFKSSGITPPLNWGPNWSDLGQFTKDVTILRSFGLNAQRLGVPWEKINPEDGVFDRQALAKFRQEIDVLQEIGLQPIPTLNHFTLPLWEAKQGGWENPKTVKDFKKFTEIIAQECGDVKLWLTLNEPNLIPIRGGLWGITPPQKRSPLAAFAIGRGLVNAHKVAYETIKKQIPDAQVGAAHYISWSEAYNPHSLSDRLITNVQNYILNLASPYLLPSDFIGINSYTAYFIRHNWRSLKMQMRPDAKDMPEKSLFLETVRPNTYVSDIGLPIVPDFFLKGLLEISNRFPTKPIYITENGISDQNDVLRLYFMLAHLAAIKSAREQGANIKGYLTWSSVDNIGWEGELDPCGLIRLDPETNERTTSKALEVYHSIINTGKVGLDKLAEKYLPADQKRKLYGISLPTRQETTPPSQDQELEWPPKSLLDYKTLYPGRLEKALRFVVGKVLSRFGHGKITHWGDWSKRVLTPFLKGTTLEGDSNAFEIPSKPFFKAIAEARMSLNGWKTGYIVEPMADPEEIKDGWLYAFQREGNNYIEICNIILKGDVFCLAPKPNVTVYALNAKDGRELPLRAIGGLRSRFDPSITCPCI